MSQLHGDRPSGSEIKIVHYMGSCSSAAIGSARPVVGRGRGGPWMLHLAASRVGTERSPMPFLGSPGLLGGSEVITSQMLKAHCFSAKAHD